MQTFQLRRVSWAQWIVSAGVAVNCLLGWPFRAGDRRRPSSTLHPFPVGPERVWRFEGRT